MHADGVGKIYDRSKRSPSTYSAELLTPCALAPLFHIQVPREFAMSLGILQSFSAALFVVTFCVGCTHQNPQDLKEKTAHVTAQLKRDASAVASGIREGWSQYKTLDVNTATKEQLMTLPSVTAAEADRIIAGRPYDRPEDLVTRHVISKKEFERISDLLKVKKG